MSPIARLISVISGVLTGCGLLYLYISVPFGMAVWFTPLFAVGFIFLAALLGSVVLFAKAVSRGSHGSFVLIVSTFGATIGALMDGPIYMRLGLASIGGLLFWAYALLAWRRMSAPLLEGECGAETKILQ